MKGDIKDFDFDLGENIALLRASVGAFAAQNIAPIAAHIDRDNTFPRSLWPQRHQKGHPRPIATAYAWESWKSAWSR